MGTYPRASVPKVTSQPGYRKSPEEIHEAFDYALAHPGETLSQIGKRYGFGSSSMSNWMFAPKRAPVNPYVVEWCRQHATLDGSGPNNLAKWLKIRTHNKVGQRVLDAVSQAVMTVTTLSSVEPVVDDRLVSPNGIGTFVPGATDDLLVVKQAALDVKAEAESVAQSATELAIAIDTVRDWMSTTDRLQLALGRIQSLESQLREQDEIVKRFRQQKLATNQVHSND